MTLTWKRGPVLVSQTKAVKKMVGTKIVWMNTFLHEIHARMRDPD